MLLTMFYHRVWRFLFVVWWFLWFLTMCYHVLWRCLHVFWRCLPLFKLFNTYFKRLLPMFDVCCTMCLTIVDHGFRICRPCLVAFVEYYVYFAFCLYFCNFWIFLERMHVHKLNTSTNIVTLASPTWNFIACHETSMKASDHLFSISCACVIDYSTSPK
jgi:hypothetical protein